jgi:parvulin-like peptidyl-prolyl isomerase
MIFGYAVSKSAPLRNTLGALCGRGKLLAMAADRGIYEEDVLRAERESSYASGAALPEKAARQIPPQLIANLSIQREAQEVSIPSARIDREYRILRSQLRDEATWDAMLRANHFSRGTFRAEVAKNLRTETAIERRLALSTPDITDDRCRAYYEANTVKYRLPARFRARHLFFAAPPETSPEVVDAKKRAAEMAATRLAHGEEFAELAQFVSEDEMTKNRGGDLGFFSEHRMAPDFMAAIKNMSVGEATGIVRTGLGFHIVEVIERKLPRQMNYDEAKAEIESALENAKRQRSCAEAAHELAGEAVFIHSLDHTN